MNKFANRFLLTFSAFSQHQPAQRFGVVSTGILPSQVIVDFQDANWLQQ